MTCLLTKQSPNNSKAVLGHPHSRAGSTSLISEELQSHCLGLKHVLFCVLKIAELGHRAPGKNKQTNKHFQLNINENMKNIAVESVRPGLAHIRFYKTSSVHTPSHPQNPTPPPT